MKTPSSLKACAADQVADYLREKHKFTSPQLSKTDLKGKDLGHLRELKGSIAAGFSLESAVRLRHILKKENIQEPENDTDSLYVAFTAMSNVEYFEKLEELKAFKEELEIIFDYSEDECMPEPCRDCKATFHSFRAMYVHCQQTHIRFPKRVCHLCKKGFLFNRDLKSHLVGHA